MTKKDYELLARAFKCLRHRIKDHARGIPDERYRGMVLGWEQSVAAVADALEYDNPRFCRITFRDACGCEESDWQQDLVEADEQKGAGETKHL